MIGLDLTAFFGRLHPLLVHLPIGFILLALLFDLKWFKEKGARFNFIKIIWFLAFISSFFSALLGWLLAQNGYYIDADLTPHQYTGILLVFFSSLGWVLRIKNINMPSLFIRINNLIVLFLLILVGHLGGSLTHGSDYLIKHAPDFIKSNQEYKNKLFEEYTLDSIVVFKDLVQPLLNEKCVACHNNNISRGGLNLINIESIKKGGRSGAAFVSKNLSKSLIFKRISFSQDNEKFMPPTGTPFSYHEIQLVQWWIQEGANYTGSLNEFSTTPEIQTLLLKQYGLDTREKPWVEKVKLDPLPPSAVIALEKANFSMRTLSQNNPLLDLRYRGEKLSQQALTLMETYAPYITWLNLSNCKLTNSDLKTIAKLENLTRLNLQQNSIRTNDLAPLNTLSHLEVLNLHSTLVNQDVFEILKSIPSLKKVFLWNTKVSLNAVLKNKPAFPSTELIIAL
ncbi:MAG: c-type cytochrome domain-containing protein [Flavobacteriaceae bacterium]